jgi:hypothetical protein
MNSIDLLLPVKLILLSLKVIDLLGLNLQAEMDFTTATAGIILTEGSGNGLGLETQTVMAQGQRLPV